MHSVLIIEDDPITLYVYKSHLEKAGFDVKIAKDGEAAFYVLQKTPPHAILLDLMLPRINGVEILKTIRAHKNFETIPVFVFTNLHLSNLAKEATTAGANRVFDKATTAPLDIVAAIREAVSQRPTASAQEGISTSAATEAKTPSQTVFESNPEIEPELLRAFITKVPETFMALRKILQKLSKAEDTPERLAQLSELYEKVHAVTSGSTAAELHGISQMGAALQALAKQLAEDPKVINVSTLRTVSHAIDFLDVLFKRGICHDDAQLTPINILVVDDDRISRLAITSALARANLKMLDVECPHAALRLLKDNPFDLVFLDVSMPKMSGFELCLELRKLPNHKATPVVFITSATDFESRSRSTLSGGNDLIAKPFLFTELAVKALTYALKGRLAKSNSDSDKTSSTHKPVVEAQANPEPTDVQIEVSANPQPAIGAPARKTETQSTEPSDRPVTMSRPSSAVITMDESGAIKALNAAADALFGYEASEVVGLPVAVLIPDAQQTNKNQILIGQLISDKAKAPRSGIHFVGERKDKSTFRLSLSLSEITLASRRMFTCIVRELGEPLEAKHAANSLSMEAKSDHLTQVTESSETGIKTATPPPIDTAGTAQSNEPVSDSKSAAGAFLRVPAETAAPIPWQTSELAEARAELEKGNAERTALAARFQELADTQVGLKQELQRRKQSEADLIKAQEELEFRVQKRSNELAVAQTAWQTETAAREKLEVKTQELSFLQTARDHDLEQRKQLEHRLHQNQKQLEAQLQLQGDDLKKTQEEARKEIRERQRVEGLIKESTGAQTALNQELADRRKSEDAWRARYEELEQQFKDQNLQLAEAKSAFKKEIAKRQQLESETQKLLSAQAVVPQELIDRQKVEADLRQTQEDLEARVGEQSRKLAEVQAEYQQESTKRQKLETQTRQLSDEHTALLDQHNQLQQLEKILREKERALDSHAHDLNAQLSRIQNDLQTEISERKRLEAHATELASTHAALTSALEESKQAEATLKKVHGDLEARFQIQACESANTRSELQKEASERRQLETRVTKLSAIQDKLSEELNKQSENKALLQRERDELAAHYQQQSKTLSEAQAQLENELSHRQKLEEDASTVADELKRLEEELSDRDLVEGNLRRAKEELEAHVVGEAPKLAQLETQLLKAAAERQRVEAHATELFKAQIESAQELIRRKQTEEALRKAHTELEARLQTQAEELARGRVQLESATAECHRLANEATVLVRAEHELFERKQLEETLRRTQAELEGQVGHQTAELERVQALLEKEAAHGEKLEARAVELARAHASLTQEVSNRVLPEQALRTANSELQGLLKERGHELSKIEAQLQQEKEAHQQIIEQRAELAGSHAELNQRLVTRLQAEETLRRIQAELEVRVQHQARELARVQTELEKEICEHQKVTVRSVEIADGQAVLVGELNERKQIELDLRRAKEQLASELESQNTRLAQLQAKLLAEVSERQRLETRAGELGKAHVELSQQLAQKTETEAALRQAYVELGTIAEERLGRLNQTQAHLENTLTERDQALEQANELAQKKALVQEQLTKRQNIEAALRKTQSELEGRIATQTAELARAQAERKNQVTNREQLEQRAAELAKVQKELKQELGQRTRTEEALRRAHTELGKTAQDRANELTATRAQLQKEVAQREQVEVQAARYAATQAAFEKELDTRRQSEQTLQRSQLELRSIIDDQAARLASIDTELQQQTNERRRLEEQATKFMATNSGLTTTLNNCKENEAQLRRAQEQLKSRNDALTRELAGMQAQLEKEITERLQITDATAKLTNIQAELKGTLEEQRKIEETLRCSETELAAQVKAQAAEFGFLQTKLQKEIAQREHAQAQAAKLLETQGALEKELGARQQAEQTLRRSQQELESLIQSQVARLGSIETDLQHQTAERLRFADQASKLTAANSDLAKKLSYSQETEATLRRTQEQLQNSIEALTRELARVEAKLEKEIVEHVQLRDDAAKLTDAQVVLKGTLEEQRKIEETLRCSETELAARVKTQAAEFGFLQTKLQKEIAQREHAQAQAAKLLETQGALEKELDARHLAEQTLRRSQQELESLIQSQVARLGSIETELQQQIAERLRFADQASKLTVANSDLAKKLGCSQETEATLRRTQEQLQNSLEALTRELARVKAKLEKEIAEHVQLIDDAAKLTDAQVVLKGTLEEQRKIEETLRCSETELAAQVKAQAAEFGFLQTKLQKEIAQREHAQAQAAKLLETQGALEKELGARQQAEQTLRRSQQELESLIQSQVARLGSIETDLQHQTAERLRFADQASKLTAANSDLAKKLSYSQETEATLRRTQEQLQNSIEALTRELARVEAKLEKEIVEHVQLRDDAAKLTDAQVVLKKTLEEQRKIEETLRCSETELAARVKTQAAEFSFLQTELQRETVRREQTEIREEELARKQTDLLKELTNRKASEQCLRGIEQDLRVQIQAQGSEIEHLQIEFRKENQERLQVIERATELAKIQIALKQKIFEHEQIENQLHRTRENLENQIETQAVELTHTRAHLEKEIAELKQAKEKTLELATGQAAFKREISEQKATEEALRQRQSELEVRLHNSTSALASTQADVQTENAKRTLVETELGQVRYSTLEFSRVKSEFLHKLSQQIRHPANSVLEISGKLRKTPLTGEQNLLLESLQANAEVLLGSDRRITEFSRFQVEPVRFESLPFDLYPVVEGAIESSRVLAQGKDIELASLIYQEVPTFVRGDQNRLLQILRHLVTTSVEFTQTGPVLLRVTTEIDNQTELILRFSVNCDRPNEFQEIQRWLLPASGEANRPPILESGPVLDLAVARQLIEMSSGRFGMEPGANEGAVLWCTLRLAKLSVVPGSVQVPVARPPALRVLVVESHHARSEVFSSQLTVGGVRNSTIFTAVDALSLLRNQALAGDPFSVAIVSSDLPDMNGLTLAKIAKAEPLLNATHFIIATAAAKLPDETQLTTTGVTACLIRPIRQSQLFAALEKTIGKTGERTPGINESQLPVATPATPPKTACSQNLQIVRVGPFGEAPQGTIRPFEHLA